MKLSGKLSRRYGALEVEKFAPLCCPGLNGGGALAIGAATTNRTLYDLGLVTTGMHAVRFVNNSARGPGGAVRAGPFGNVAMNDCHFLDNSAMLAGGGLALDAPNPSAFTNSSFANNVVFNGDGGALAFGSDPTGTAPPAAAASVMNNVTVHANVVDFYNGVGHGAGVLINEGTIIYAHCHFASNKNLDADGNGREDDVCAYGKGTVALFKPQEKPPTCGPCDGAGACP